MTESKQIPSLIAPAGHGDTERLGAQERVTIADRLLRDATVKKMYVRDIVHCVVDMIPEIAAAERFTFVRKIYDFINESQNFNGKEGFDVFSVPLLMSLCESERLSLADLFRQGLQANYVISCEAHLWGLVYVLPTLPCARHNEYVQAMLDLAEETTLRGMTIEAMTRVIFNMPREHRASIADFIAERLRYGAKKELKHFVVQVLSDATPSLDESERVTIANTVVPLVFDADIHLARRVLIYLGCTLGSLPEKQRYHYALLISVLANDLSFGCDVCETLKQVLPLLTSAQERAHITWVISHLESRHERPAGLSEYASQPIHMSRD